MKGKHALLLSRLVAAILPALAVLALAGCGPADTVDLHNGYRLLTVTKGVCSYSLEYPADYRRNGPDVYNGTDVYVELYTRDMAYLTIEVPDPPNGPMKRVTVSYCPEVMHVDVWGSGRAPGSAAERLEGVLHPKWGRLEVLERGQITVSSVVAEKASYLESRFILAPSETDLTFNIQVYFEYNGLMLVLEASGDRDRTDSIKANFEHLIQTFKIIGNTSVTN